MDKKTTLNDLTHFYLNEKSLCNELLHTDFENKKYETVSKQTISNILNYSKVLSIRDSKILGKMELILN